MPDFQQWNWTQILLTILASVGTFTVVIGAVLAFLGSLAKKLATHWMDRQIELYRSRLDKESAEFKGRLELEALEHASRLERDRSEHTIRFESLHQRRADALCKIWLAMKEARQWVDAFVSPVQGSEERQTKRGEEASARVRNLRTATFENTIFFSKPLADRVEALTDKIHSINFRASLAYHRATEQGGNPYDEKSFDAAWDKLSDEIDPVLAEIEAEFRRLLGV